MPPIKYTFQLKLGDQVQKINRYLMHLAFSLYKDDYLGKEVMAKQDEELLRLAAIGKLSDKIIEKVQTVKDKLLQRKILETRNKGYKDEWFEFQEEENVYEETVQINETPRALNNFPSLKKTISVPMSYEDPKFKFENDETDEVFSKATLGLHLVESKLTATVQIKEEKDGDEEDQELEKQLTNRFQNLVKSAVSEPIQSSQLIPLSLMQTQSAQHHNRPQVKEANHAIAALKTKLQLNKLRLEDVN